MEAPQKALILHRLRYWLLMIQSLPQERLIGEGEVVKEIETFGKFLCPDVEHDI
jgi:hypothetical protein